MKLLILLSTFVRMLPGSSFTVETAQPAKNFAPEIAAAAELNTTANRIGARARIMDDPYGRDDLYGRHGHGMNGAGRRGEDRAQDCAI